MESCTKGTKCINFPELIHQLISMNFDNFFELSNYTFFAYFILILIIYYLLILVYSQFFY